MPSFAEGWERIHRWLAGHAPKILASLNPGADDQDLLAAEKSFGCEMPADWKECYRTHDGLQDGGNFSSLFFGMDFLPLKKVLDERAKNSASSAAGYTPLVVRAADAGVKCADMYNPRWIALAHDWGDTLLRVDMDPATGGQIGQIIFTDHTDDIVIVVAPDMAQLLIDFAADLEADRYFLNPDAAADGNEFLSCVEEIDIVNWTKSPRWERLRDVRHPRRKG